MKIVGAFGGKAADLGGYRDHNPFRLFVRERFRAFLRGAASAGEEEQVHLLIAVDLGPGQWFAEVAQEEGRSFRLIVRPGADEKWTATQKARLAQLSAVAEDVVESDEPEAFVAGGLISRLQGFELVRRAAFVAAEGGKLTGRISREAARLRGAKVPVTWVAPEDLPAEYHALAAVEEARAKLTDSLAETVASSRARLAEIVASGNLRPRAEARVRERLRELTVLEETVASLRHRAGEGR